MSSTTVKVDLSGWDNLKKRMNFARKNKIEVGVLGPSEHPSGMTTATIGFLHEMGDFPNFPAREWLGPILEERYRSVLSSLASSVLRGGVRTKYAREGYDTAFRVADWVANNNYELAPATVELKKEEGLPRPEQALYATGTLAESIKYKVGPK